MKALPLIPALTAEALGTGLIVLAGTGAMVWDSLHEGVLGVGGIALVFGLAVALAIMLFARHSGAHCNPAVSLALCGAGHLPKQRLAPYIAAQCLGAASASALLAWLAGSGSGLGRTLPSHSPYSAFLLELCMSALLVWLILLFVNARLRVLPIALMVGALVGVAAFLGGPLTGASMNPARSFGPALLAWHWQHFWIYLLAPLAGAWTALTLCRIKGASCCRPAGATPDFDTP